MKTVRENATHVSGHVLYFPTEQRLKLAELGVKTVELAALICRSLHCCRHLSWPLVYCGIASVVPPAAAAAAAAAVVMLVMVVMISVVGGGMCPGSGTG